MASTSSFVNGSSSHIHLQRTEDRKCSGRLDLYILDCPVCCEPLTIPVFQCDKGHLACSSCCPKLSNKCPACSLPIGNNRCVAMERVLESVIVQCANAEFGCTKKLSYWNKPTHEKECTFTQCSCPALDCDYTGSDTDLYKHFLQPIHKIIYWSGGFTCGKPFDVRMKINDKVFVKREYMEHLLFTVQCFREVDGVYLTVSFIAPSAPEVGEFSYYLSYTVDGNSITHESTVKGVLELSFQRPEESYMLIPHSLLSGERLEMKLCIKKLNQE